MENTLKIRILADCPQWAPTLAQWTYQEWHKYDPTLTYTRALESLHLRLNRDKIPLVLVAEKNGKPIGMATLKESVPVSGHETKSPWLGSFYVVPEERGQGVASTLMSEIKKYAMQWGVKTLHLFSSDTTVVSWYEKHGWKLQKIDRYQDHEVAIMSCDLS